MSICSPKSLSIFLLFALQQFSRSKCFIQHIRCVYCFVSLLISMQNDAFYTLMDRNNVKQTLFFSFYFFCEQQMQCSNVCASTLLNLRILCKSGRYLMFYVVILLLFTIFIIHMQFFPRIFSTFFWILSFTTFFPVRFSYYQ